MEHPPTNQGLDQTSHITADAWLEFFALCLEFSEVARLRQAARLAEVPATSSTTDEASVQPKPKPSRKKRILPKGQNAPHT
jgi:hypothetical protein